MQFVPILAAAGEAGGYLSIVKVLPIVVLFLGWMWILTWIDKDTEAAHLPRELLNSGLFIGSLVAFALFLLLPNYWVALGAYVVLFFASVGTYLAIRNKQVGLDDLKRDFATWKSGMRSTKKKQKAKADQILFATKQGNGVVEPEEEEPEYLGYTAAQEMLLTPFRKEAEVIELRAGEGNGTVQYIVDGVGYPLTTMDKGKSAACVTFLKGVAGMDVEDRRKPQTGLMRATVDGKRRDLEIRTAGTTAGESMRVSVDPKKRADLKLEDLGFSPEQLEAMKACIAEQKGIVLVAAPRQQGLTTMLYSILRSHDAFLNHIQTIEHAPREEMEGITQNKLAAAVSAAEEYKLVQWVTSQQPDVLMIDEITNPSSAKELVRAALEGDGRRIYLGMRQGSTFDALTAWRALVGDDALAARALKMIISGRVMRRLCMACKVGYSPDPETLRKLNMEPSKVDKLYQARTQPLLDAKGNPIACEFCHDLRYKRRFGVYETFPIDDEVRQVAAAGASVNQLKTLFRKQRCRYLQEVALAQVQAGETSVQEVLRVLKGSQSAAKAPPTTVPSA